MKRIGLIAGLALALGAVVALAAPDADPWVHITNHWRFMRPIRAEQEARFAFVDAGAFTVSGTLTTSGATKLGGFDAGYGTIHGPLAVNGNLSVLGTAGLGRVTTVQALDAGIYSKVGGVSIGGEVAQDGGVASHVCQHGYGAMTGGELAVTYTRAFSSNASCICSHTQTTNTNACGIKTGTAPSTTAVTFAVASGDTDVVFWICCGDL